MRKILQKHLSPEYENKRDQKIFMNSQNLDLPCCIKICQGSEKGKSGEVECETVCHFFSRWARRTTKFSSLVFSQSTWETFDCLSAYIDKYRFENMGKKLTRTHSRKMVFFKYSHLDKQKIMQCFSIVSVCLGMNSD